MAETWLERNDSTITTDWIQKEGTSGGFNREGEEKYI